MEHKKILVLCTGNSARSQIAEGLFRKLSGGRIQAFSAGTQPKGINPLAIETMNEIGIDISQQYSKDVSEFKNEEFDFVITVCDNAKESCPVFPGSQTLHWSTPDPKDAAEFRNVRDQLSKQITEFLENLS